VKSTWFLCSLALLVAEIAPLQAHDRSVPANPAGADGSIQMPTLTDVAPAWGLGAGTDREDSGERLR
jgi:hypothetical protein